MTDVVTSIMHALKANTHTTGAEKDKYKWTLQKIKLKTILQIAGTIAGFAASVCDTSGVTHHLCFCFHQS